MSSSSKLVIICLCGIFFSVFLIEFRLQAGLAQIPDTMHQHTSEQDVPTQDHTALRINEFMASNDITLVDPDDPTDFPDWIELYNPTDSTISLAGLALTDNPEDPAQYEIPPELSIGPKGYLLFYADNDNDEGPLHTNFGLSGGGEFIGLYDIAAGGFIHSYTFGTQNTDVSMGLEPDGVDGTWRFYERPTPGLTNQIMPPVISSVQRSTDIPAKGVAVQITVHASDDQFPPSVAIFYSVNGGDYTNMIMTFLEGTLYQAEIPPQPLGAWVRYYVTATDSDNLGSQSPANAPQRTHQYIVGYQPPQLYINEFMPNNVTTLNVTVNMTTTTPDWIELYNPTDVAIGLDGFYLTDDLADPIKYAIPNGLSVPAGGYLLFYADNEPEAGPQHTNFGLSNNGEAIGLFSPFGAHAIDTIVYDQHPEDVSRGRFEDGTENWALLICPTPGQANEYCNKNSFLPIVSR
ncbi:MAG: lamin tail domain-containing protein [Chloroflexota bacterium]